MWCRCCDCGCMCCCAGPSCCGVAGRVSGHCAGYVDTVGMSVFLTCELPRMVATVMVVCCIDEIDGDSGFGNVVGVCIGDGGGDEGRVHERGAGNGNGVDLGVCSLWV